MAVVGLRRSGGGKENGCDTKKAPRAIFTVVEMLCNLLYQYQHLGYILYYILQDVIIRKTLDLSWYYVLHCIHFIISVSE